MQVNIDNYDAIDMLVNRVKYWTDDSEVIDLFEQYYTSMVDGGCFDGCNFDVMSIVDNDYVNNTSITTLEEFEQGREEYIKEQMEADGFIKEEMTEEEYNETYEQYNEDTTTWEDLERGENTCPFLSGYYIEAVTDSCLLMS